MEGRARRRFHSNSLVPWPSATASRTTLAPCSGSPDRKSTRLNSSHRCISYAVFCLKKGTPAPSRSRHDHWRGEPRARSSSGGFQEVPQFSVGTLLHSIPQEFKNLLIIKKTPQDFPLHPMDG